MRYIATQRTHTLFAVGDVQCRMARRERCQCGADAILVLVRQHYETPVCVGVAELETRLWKGLPPCPNHSSPTR